MKIGLIHVDGKKPNLALMKLSAYHKQKGDTVELVKPLIKTGNEVIINDFDKIYMSVVFKENVEKTKRFASRLKNVEIGGYFFDSKKVLPYEIEHIMPDYEIYKCNYSMGFATRGCIRNCEFCIVPKKEGMITPNADIYEFWNKCHKHLVLLDNNILALPKHFEKIASQIIKNNLSVDFNQGLDIRLVNEKNIKLLSSLDVKPSYRFAFDNPALKDVIIKKVALLKQYDIRGMFYVLVGFNTTWEEDMYRIELLKKLGQRPYVMRYKTVKGITKYADLSSWVNQYKFFASMSWDDFLKCKEDRSRLHYKKYQKRPIEKWI